LFFYKSLQGKHGPSLKCLLLPEENWLPPDNFQEVPVSIIAHRTSPTNIGLSLLANLTAHDFGYINTEWRS